MQSNTERPSRMSSMHSAAGADVLNIAHRGARAYAPENTLPAFQKAIDLGCHMIELDVHLTKDGQLVVHHDDDLVRCTNITQCRPGSPSYLISDFALAELMELDAGSWFSHQLDSTPKDRQGFLRTLKPAESARFIGSADANLYSSGRVKIPTLDQALALIKSAGILVNIEIKSLPRMYAGIAAKVVECVEFHGLVPTSLISSFDHEQLRTVRSLNAKVATAVLSSDRLAMVASYLRLLDADAYHPGCYGDFDSLGFGSTTGDINAPELATEIQGGLHVNVWACNNQRHMAALLDFGVTGIISDYPNRVSTALLGKGAQTPKVP